MKKQILLPHQCKWIGYGLLILGIATFFFSGFLEKQLTFNIENNFYFKWLVSLDNDSEWSGASTSQDFSYTLQILLIVAGGLLVMFSKEKTEDEFTMHIRLQSLMLSVLINYLILLVADLLLYGSLFLYVMCYGFYAIVVLYVLIFHFLLYKNSRKEVER